MKKKTAHFFTRGIIAGMACGCLMLLLTACEEISWSKSRAQKPATPKAVAVLVPTQGNQIQGVVTFTETAEGVRIEAKIQGLSPGKHGFHIHQFGDCRAPDASSAGGHYNPLNSPHGGPGERERHAGDLGNLLVRSDGNAQYERVDTQLRLSGEHSIIGRALVVHEKEDDLTSQPSGNAGARIACGVIGYAE